jgi:benzoate membrane transport protein
MAETPPASATSGVRALLPAISVAIPILIFGVAGLSILLAVAETFALTSAQTSTLIVISFGFSSIVSLGMTAAYRQPLYIICSSASLIFMASLADTFAYSDMLGATAVAGATVMLLGTFGLSSWLGRLVPAPIVLAILAGLVMPFVVRIFTDMDADPLTVGATVAAFVLGRRVLPPSIPPLLPALVIGVLVAAALGDVHTLSTSWALPTMTMTRPTFSWQAILTISPVIVVLMAPLSNLSAVVILRGFQFEPPARVIDIASGAATILVTPFAPVPINMGNFVTALTAGPEAGEHHQRHWSVYASSSGTALIALTASVAVGIQAAVPLTLLFAVAGLALAGYSATH